jgi:hypothetical protein
MANIIYGLITNVISSAIITPRISFPVSINYNIKKNDTEEVKDIDFFQMEKLLSWMKLFFEEETVNENETIKAYRQELYNIYVGIVSNYKQYQQWKKYNNNIWVLSSYRSKNTKDLSKQILADIQLFNEGIKMFYLLNNKK